MWVVIVIAALGAPAAAEDRAPVLDVEGASGVVLPTGAGADVEQSVEPTQVGILRATVAWERPALPMPATRGSAWAIDLGPALGAGIIGNDRRGDAFAEAGLRLNLRFAQREMGLLHVSARGGMWLAARGGVLGDEHNAMAEGDLGWYVWLGDHGWRVGWEVGVLGVRNPTVAGDVMPLYASPAQPDEVTTIAHVALFVGIGL
jgi:hypothetical protein